MSSFTERRQALARARVAAGMSWLKEHAPDRIDKIDLARLDLACKDRCVLAQAYDGKYSNVVAGLGLTNRAEAFGFLIPNGQSADISATKEGQVAYGELTNLWRLAICAHRRANAQAVFVADAT